MINISFHEVFYGRECNQMFKSGWLNLPRSFEYNYDVSKKSFVSISPWFQCCYSGCEDPHWSKWKQRLRVILESKNQLILECISYSPNLFCNWAIFFVNKPELSGLPLTNKLGDFLMNNYKYLN